MSSRPTIADLARAAGVSVATVDRVLNGRLPVRKATAHLVYEAAEVIGYHAAALIKRRMEDDRPRYRLGFVLQRPNQQFYQLLAATIEKQVAGSARCRGTVAIDYLDTQTPDEIAMRLRTMAERADAIAMVSIDHPTVTAATAEIRAKGISVFSVLSDFAQGVRNGYVGLDNRKVGRTAAWLVAHTAPRAGKLGILVGSHRFIGHETREIGFRSYFREFAPQFEVLDAQVNLEAGNIAHEATLGLLRKYPDLVGLYIAGGGMEGAIAALRKENMAGKIAVVCNENTTHTRAGLTDNFLAAVIATPAAELSAVLVNLMIDALEGGSASMPGQVFLPMEILTAENI